MKFIFRFGLLVAAHCFTFRLISIYSFNAIFYLFIVMNRCNAMTVNCLSVCASFVMFGHTQHHTKPNRISLCRACVCLNAPVSDRVWSHIQNSHLFYFYPASAIEIRLNAMKENRAEQMNARFYDFIRNRSFTSYPSPLLPHLTLNF